MARDTYDYVIVGAGSAGCVLAGRLSQDPQARVLLIEAGPPDTKPAIRIPAGAWSLMSSEVDWSYTTAPQDALGGRNEPWPRGKTLGGSSSINAQVYLRGDSGDFDGWAALGNEGWSYDAVEPYFKRAEGAGPDLSGHYGGEGPLRLSRLSAPHPLGRGFKDACVERGVESNEGFRRADLLGVGQPLVTQSYRRRWSVADAYLHPVRSRPNLKVLTGALATRVLLDSGLAVGVEYRQDGQELTAHAGSEVILCGGVVNSPQLLMLSGIGPGDHLKAVGVTTILDLPGVGLNLQDHLGVPVQMTMNQAALPDLAAAFLHLLRYYVGHTGALTSNRSEVCAFLKSSPDLEAADLALLFTPPPLPPLWPKPRWVAAEALGIVGRYLPLVPDRFTAGRPHPITIAAMVLRPASVGHIRLASPDPLANPIIQPNYLSDPAGRDLSLLVEGVRTVRSICRSPALASLLAGEWRPGPQVGTDAEIAGYVRRAAVSIKHPVGTCKMGIDGLAVVDPELRVHGVRGLRVVDASIMPVIPRGHMNAPTVMIAEKAADLIARARKRRDDASIG
ncbi:MAG: GMC family oxidoreductase N-terminal domain-containing protein [Actinomycetota bacterium]